MKFFRAEAAGVDWTRVVPEEIVKQVCEIVYFPSFSLLDELQLKAKVLINIFQI